MRCRTSCVRLAGLVVLVVICGSSANTRAQSDACRTINESAGYTVRSVKVEGRWVPDIQQLGLSDLVGKTYSPPMVSDAQSKISDLLTRDENKAIQSAVLGVYSVLFIRSCVLADDAAKQVDIVIKPAYLRVDLYKVGSNKLPIPRSLLPTFFQFVPKPLLAFNPTFAAGYDGRGGFAPAFGISTNLLDLPDLLKGDKVTNRATRLDVTASGRKSIGDPFYNSDGTLVLKRLKPGTVIEELAVDGSFSANDDPMGEGEHLRNSVTAGGKIRLRPRAGLVDVVEMAGHYRWSDDRLRDTGAFDHVASTENAFDGRVLTDGQIGDAFTRIGVWLDAAEPSGGAGSYRRLAVLAGMARDFGRLNQTFGVEAIVGAGKAWGAVPQYARFFGGNGGRDFLYDDFEGPTMSSFPTGPLIRSYGVAQAPPSTSMPNRGGTSYWHINLNLTVPIPPLSRPLVPNVVISDDNGQIKTLKDKLKGFAIGSAIGGIADTMIDQIIDDLMKQGMPEQEATQKAAVIATERATKIVGHEIKPAVTFIADKANLYAIKPLLMFDAARINSDQTDNRTRYALGGGVQLTIVIARFEAGYLRSLNRFPGDRKGNFIARLVFQNLF